MKFCKMRTEHHDDLFREVFVQNKVINAMMLSERCRIELTDQHTPTSKLRGKICLICTRSVLTKHGFE